jgi:hypothetical protein
MSAADKTLQKLSVIWYRMAQNIDEDRLELFLVTSEAAGKEPSEGYSMGAGKSTFALQFTYRAWAYYNGTLIIDLKNQQIIDETPPDVQRKIYADIINNWLYWKLKHLIRGVDNAGFRVPCVWWDDAQRDCPAWQRVPEKKRKLIEELTVKRPLVANIIMTAPSMSDIAKPLRRLVKWEIIIPQRGLYEVQFKAKKRDFYNPTEDLERLWYDATGTFQPPPPDIWQLYLKRRIEAAKTQEEEEETEETEEKEEESKGKDWKHASIKEIAEEVVKHIDEYKNKKGKIDPALISIKLGIGIAKAYEAKKYINEYLLTPQPKI